MLFTSNNPIILTLSPNLGNNYESQPSQYKKTGSIVTVTSDDEFKRIITGSTTHTPYSFTEMKDSNKSNEESDVNGWSAVVFDFDLPKEEKVDNSTPIYENENELIYQKMSGSSLSKFIKFKKSLTIEEFKNSWMAQNFNFVLYTSRNHKLEKVDKNEPAVERFHVLFPFSQMIRIDETNRVELKALNGYLVDNSYSLMGFRVDKNVKDFGRIIFPSRQSGKSIDENFEIIFSDDKKYITIQDIESFKINEESLKSSKTDKTYNKINIVNNTSDKIKSQQQIDKDCMEVIHDTLKSIGTVTTRFERVMIGVAVRKSIGDDGGNYLFAIKDSNGTKKAWSDSEKQYEKYESTCMGFVISLAKKHNSDLFKKYDNVDFKESDYDLIDLLMGLINNKKIKSEVVKKYAPDFEQVFEMLEVKKGVFENRITWNKIQSYLTELGFEKRVDFAGETKFYFRHSVFSTEVKINTIKNVLIEMARCYGHHVQMASVLSKVTDTNFLCLASVGIFNSPIGLNFKNGYYINNKLCQYDRLNHLILKQNRNFNDSLEDSSEDSVDRDFIPKQYENGSAYTFVKDISRNQKNELDDFRFDIFCKMIGYYIHFKKEFDGVAFILTDYNEDVQKKGSDGGNGKSTLIQLLKRYMTWTVIDGKNHKQDETFAISSFTEGSKLLAFDDIDPSKFDLEALFNMIRGEGLKIRYMKTNEFIIPFLISPKILITTNKPKTLKGNSFTSRYKTLEFSNYYKNPQTTIKSKFGSSIPFSVTSEESQKTDNFMAKCLDMYLSDKTFYTKIVNADSTKLNQFIDETGKLLYSTITDAVKNICEDGEEVDYCETVDKYNTYTIKFSRQKVGSRGMTQYFDYNEFVSYYMRRFNQNKTTPATLYEKLDDFFALKYFDGDKTKITNLRKRLNVNESKHNVLDVTFLFDHKSPTGTDDTTSNSTSKATIDALTTDTFIPVVETKNTRKVASQVTSEVKIIDSVKQEVKPQVKQQVENIVKAEANLSVEIQPTVKQEVTPEVNKEVIEYVKQQYETGVTVEVIKEKLRRKNVTISIKEIETIIENEYNDDEFEFDSDILPYNNNSKTEVKQEVETDFDGCVIRYKDTEFYCNDVKLYNDFELLKEKGQRVYFTFVSEEDWTASLN